MAQLITRDKWGIEKVRGCTIPAGKENKLVVQIMQLFYQENITSLGAGICNPSYNCQPLLSLSQMQKIQMEKSFEMHRCFSSSRPGEEGVQGKLQR